MKFNNNAAYSAKSATTVDQGLRSYMLKVYNYMASALALTGIIAMLVASNENLIQTIHYTGLRWVVMLAPLAIVFFMSLQLNKLSLFAVQALFWAYSAILGVSLSYIFLAYTSESIARVFFVTASIFGAMSIYGYSTKRDLTGIGSFLIMGLFGVIIASLVNIFLASSALQFAVSIISVIIFTGLTAYDTQKIKSMYYSVAGLGDIAGKYAIMAALALYMDFINIFIQLLHLFGNRK